MIRCGHCGHLADEEHPYGGHCTHVEHGSRCPCPYLQIQLPA